LDGLVALRQNLSNVSGTHLLDPGGEYNLPFIRHLFPDRKMQVVTLSYREQGLMFSSGNPKAIHSLSDLTRPDVTFINRNPGSGTRLWFDHQLQILEIPTESVHGYEIPVSTHTECARLVQAGKADVAVGLRASARQFGLDFITLFHERYDIVFPQDQSLMLAPFLDTLQTGAFRQRVEALTGYETTHTGEQIPL
jgi:putative molybdopterin biosynthesis protein